ncbi:Kelch domain-containing protein 10 [Thelohanellus kitauei]|uniref:Kelch domain-containing protein 10 n=1 Tax=Thelohanellus kitauei TaxID=669202 RepID=A0A0C2J2Q0_THEKT|nr:Kelch domain-containing protein 10 [Thelohanellus kitauei]
MSQGGERTKPRNRTCHCMTSVREYLIMYGGFTEWCNEEHYGLWIYNTVSGVWRRYQTPIVSANASFESSICTDGNLVYIFGGVCCRNNYLPTNSLISFNIVNDAWKTLSPHIDDYDENTPPPMCDNLLFYHNEFLYVLGGINDDEQLDTMYKFCLRTSTWSFVEQNGTKPSFDGKILGTVFENQFYHFGGMSNVFDFSTNTWTSRATKSKTGKFPDERSEESFTFSDNIGYLSGGENLKTRTIYSDVWKFDLATLEWLKLDCSLQTSLYSHCTSVVEDYYLYVFGGLGIESDRLKTFERFIIRPPALYRSCLESICGSPNFESYTTSLPAEILDEINFHIK